MKQARAAPSATDQPTEPAPRQVQQLSVEPPASALPTPPQTAPEPRQATTFPPAPDNATPAHGFALLPWLLAAFALGAGGAFLFLRNRNRTATAGGPELDLFAAPEPVAELPPAPAPPRSPEPAPPPPPKPIPPAAPTGIVSTALRPWIEIAIQPQRCVVTERDVTIEFDLELFNSGGNPARDISIEGVIINAGASQDAELGSFFANPPVPGNRIDVIRPIHRVNIPTQLVIPRAFVVPVQMGDRQMFVPVLAFNAIYPVGSSEGRTSVSFLVGRDGNGDKLAPFRLDLGPRVFRQLGARQLPTGIRR